MNSVAVKFFCRNGSKWVRRTAAYNSIRMGSNNDKFPPLKAEPCPPSPSSQSGACPQPPPCPSMPTTPPPLCPQPPNAVSPDPNNPCNYTPPPCKDPDYPDMAKIKKLQCKFQEDNGLPVYLKGGTKDVIIYHTTLILTFVSVMMTFYNLYQLSNK